MKITKLHITTIGLLLLALPAIASASIPSLPGTTTYPQDYSIRMLDMVLGNNWYSYLAGGSASGAGTVLSSMLMYFNNIILTVVSMLIVYTYATGIADTAHKGKAMGEKYSTLWTPLRQAGAITALAPLPGLGGISLMQAMVAWMVAMSISLANGVWDAGLSYVASHNGEVSQPLQSPLSRSTLQSMATMAAGVTSMEEQGLTSTGGLVCNKAASGKEEYCESPKLTGKGGTTVPIGAFGTIGVTCDGSGTCANNGTALEAAWSPTINAAVSMQEYANGTTNKAPSLSSFPNTARVGFADAVTSSITTAMKKRTAQSNYSLKSQLKTAKQYGWAAAGSLFYQLAAFNGKIAGMESVSTNYQAGTGNTTLTGTYSAVNKALQTAISEAPRPGVASQTAQVENHSKGVYAWLSNRVNKAVYPIFSGLLGEFSGSVNTDPIKSLQSSGDMMIDASSGIYLAYTGLMITDRGFISGVNQANVPVLGLFDGTGAAKVLARVAYTALKTFYVLMEIIVTAIFGAGITLAYYLPLAPALMFSLAVVGWIILVLEAFVAAPIWAAAHAMPTGDGLSGDHGGRGYPFMMDLLFRPVLLVFALFMCIGVMNASLWFVMSMLEIAFKAEMAGSMMGLLSIIIGLVIITMAVFATVNRSIEIISWLPGSVIRWFGQGQGQDTGESKHTATVAAGASGGQYADKISSSSSSHTSMAQGVKPSKEGK